MRFPDLLVQFAELERRQRLLDADLNYIRQQLRRIQGATDYIGPDATAVSRETQLDLFDAEQ